MRGSDLVDLAAEVLPRKWVQFAVFALCAWVVLSGDAGIVMWYVLDKAEGLTEMMQQVLADVFAQMIATSGETPAFLHDSGVVLQPPNMVELQQ